MLADLLSILDRLATSAERIASVLEASNPKSTRVPKARAREAKRVTRRSPTVTPNDLDRARAARVLKGMGYLRDDGEKT